MKKNNQKTVLSWLAEVFVKLQKLGTETRARMAKARKNED